jgi:hypothetical protein
MISRRTFLSAASLFFVGFSVTDALARRTEVRTIELTTAPPPPREEREPVGRRGYVWAPGYWRWNGRRYTWVAGHWMRERRASRWVAPHWDERNGRYHFVGGRWERG